MLYIILPVLYQVKPFMSTISYIKNIASGVNIVVVAKRLGDTIETVS